MSIIVVFGTLLYITKLAASNCMQNLLHHLYTPIYIAYSKPAVGY